MQILPIVSAKGGVGKTTITANLASAFAANGRRVLAIDLDPQNALRFHLALEPERGDAGLVAALQHKQRWADVMLRGRNGVIVLPYGAIDDEQQTGLEQHLASHPAWLHETLLAFSLPPETLILIDTPPGPTVYLQQALRVSSLNVVTLLADAGSAATLPLLERMISKYCESRSDFLGNAYVINQSDPGKRLNREVHELLRKRLGDEWVGSVHLDQAVSEALASAQPVRSYAPLSQAANDFVQCAERLAQRLTVAPTMRSQGR